ncbi:MAG: FtsX-like permease family protein, partial [Thermoplasmata archaeon]|nr:FtsX-like permease family protein [Thermoplasmata archaeon]
QVDEALLAALIAQPQVTGARGNIVAFSSWNGTSLVVRGMSGSYGELSSYADDFGPIPWEGSDSHSSAHIGRSLMERSGITPPCTIPLVGSYSSKIEFVEVVTWFESSGPLDDELVVSADVARYLSGMPSGKVSFITVTTSDPSWLSELLSPQKARFTMFDMHLSEALVAESEQIEVSATVRNWGTAEGSCHVTLLVDGAEQDAEDLVIGPLSEKEVVFEWEGSHFGLGEHTVTVSLGGDFPVVLNATYLAVEPYLRVSAPSRVALGEAFQAVVTTFSGAAADGATVTFLDQTAVADADGVVSLQATDAGDGTVGAALAGFAPGSAAVTVYDPSTFPAEFLPSVASFTVEPASIMESDDATGVVVVENGGTVAGFFEVEVTVDSSAYATLNVSLPGMSSATASVPLSGLSPGAHTVQAGDYSVELAVVPWFADEPDLVELVVRYGGSSAVSSSSSLPLYQAAKISEGNVAVALFSIGAVSALVSSLSIVAACAKEVHEGRRKLGVLKTVGASSRAIRRFVFPQALLLGLGGGAAGVLLGFVAVTVMSSYAGLMVFGHELSFSLDLQVALLSLLGAVVISIASALASAEMAARETAIATIKKLPAEAPPQVDVDELLRER